MIDFNVFLTFALGTVVQETRNLRAGEFVSQRVEDIVRWKALLRTITSAEQYHIFPETLECVDDLLEILVMLIPDVIQGTIVQERVIGANDIQRLFTAQDRLTTTFEKESIRTLVAALQRQRAFDTHTLIEAIETAFSPTTWERLSRISKREMEESGRCLAFERYTAAGFHALRAVEYEIRDYVHLLTRSEIRSSDRNWGHYIKVLAEHHANQKLIALLTDIKNLDRNPLIHPQHWLDIDDAVAIFCSTQTALDRLTSDMWEKNLLRPIPVTASSD